MKFIEDSVITNLPAKKSEALQVIFDHATAVLNDERRFRQGKTDYRLNSLYMKFVSELAEDIGVENLSPSSTINNESVTEFQGDVERAIIRLKLAEKMKESGSHSHKGGSSLSRRTRSWLRHEAEQLRVYVSETDISEKKKELIRKKIDELIAEIERDSPNLMKVLTAVAAVTTILSGGLNIVSNIPKAAASITRLQVLVGEELVDEEILAALAAPEAVKSLTYNPHLKSGE